MAGNFLLSCRVDLIVLSVITDFAHFLCKRERGFTCVSYVYSSFDMTYLSDKLKVSVSSV